MCEKEISPNAEFCPNCGEPMKKINNTLDVCNIVLVKVLNKNKNAIRIIKEIKSITGCALIDAKSSIDKSPSIIIKNINYSKAVNYK